MITKTFEIRDRATFIPVLAVKLSPACERDRYLLECAGYGRTQGEQSSYVVVTQINGGSGRIECAPFSWGGRTMPIAHQYIQKHFDELDSGAVVDVEFVLGETLQPKQSESARWADDG